MPFSIAAYFKASTFSLFIPISTNWQSELFDFRKFRKSLPDTQQALHWYLVGWFLDYVGRSVRHQRMLHNYRQQPTTQLGGQQATRGIQLAEQNTRELMQAVCSYITLSSFKHAFEMAKEYAEEYSWSALHYNIAALSNMVSYHSIQVKNKNHSIHIHTLARCGDSDEQMPTLLYCSG